MKKKLYAHPDIIIAVLAFSLLCLLISFYFWATDAIVVEVRRSLTAAAPNVAAGFNLDGASKLDLRGLLGQPPSSASSTSSAPVVVPPPAPTSVPVISSVTSTATTVASTSVIASSSTP